MKFLDQHRNELFEIMAKNGFDQSEFTYVKRKGRIFIQTLKPGIQFGYLRKKYTRLNPLTKQWENGSNYKLRVNSDREFDIEDWTEVKDHFDKWLAAMSPTKSWS